MAFEVHLYESRCVDTNVKRQPVLSSNCLAYRRIPLASLAMQLISRAPPTLDTRQHCQPADIPGDGGVHVGCAVVHRATRPTAPAAASRGPVSSAQYGVGAASDSWNPSLLVHAQTPPPSPSSQMHVAHEVCDEQSVDSHPTQ
jgi:hypothetical protein